MFEYFNLEYSGVSANNAVRSLTTEEDGRFGEREFGYGTGQFYSNRPDFVEPLEGSEPILFSQDGNLRGVFYDGGGAYRTYSQSVSFIGMSEPGEDSRADFLLDIIQALSGYGGTFSGRVLNNMTGMPIEGATVTLNPGTLHATTDNQGRFTLERIPNEQFSISVQRWGYTTIDEADFNFNGEEEISVDIRMLHPELCLQPATISEEVPFNETGEFGIGLTNIGDGPLEYTARLRAVQVEGNLWDKIGEFDGGSIVEDTRCQAVIFFNDHYWIAGGGSGADNPNMLYKVTVEGELVESYNQESESNYGWRDMTTDGEYIYAVDSQTIKIINPENGEIEGEIASDYMPNPAYAITYDPEADIFWLAGPTSNILGFDRNGQWAYEIPNRQRFRISGLAWHANDPDGYKLYVTSTNAARDPEVLKVNCETEESIVVANMANENGEKLSGGEFSTEVIAFTTVLVSQMEGGEDWVRLFEAGANFHWIDATPLEGALDPESEQTINISIDPVGLEIGSSYEAHIQYDHNTPIEGAIWMSIEITVSNENSVLESEINPYEFGISSFYPNPFNPTGTVEFSINQSSMINLAVYDLSGRLVTSLVNDQLAAGQYTVPVKAYDWPSGVYVVKLNSGIQSSLQKITLMK